MTAHPLFQRSFKIHCLTWVLNHLHSEPLKTLCSVSNLVNKSLPSPVETLCPMSNMAECNLTEPIMRMSNKRQLFYTSNDNLLQKRNKDLPNITSLNQLTASNHSNKRKFDAISGNYLAKETMWSEPSGNNNKSTPTNIHHKDTLSTTSYDNESPRHFPCNTTSRSPDYASAEKFIANY